MALPTLVAKKDPRGGTMALAIVEAICVIRLAHANRALLLWRHKLALAFKVFRGKIADKGARSAFVTRVPAVSHQRFNLGDLLWTQHLQ